MEKLRARAKPRVEKRSSRDTEQRNIRCTVCAQSTGQLPHGPGIAPKPRLCFNLHALGSRNELPCRNGTSATGYLDTLDAVSAFKSQSVLVIATFLVLLSIPQRNDTLKRLAVNSLYTHARQTDTSVIVAPDSEHQDLSETANIQTYKSHVKPLSLCPC